MSHELLLAPGQRVGGDFEIIRELGAGGMGAVYLARQSSTDALRALKVMRKRYRGDAEFVRRFTQEARVGARIKSRHVIEVIAAGVDDVLGMPWLAMEYLVGRTLDASMNRFGVPAAADASVLLEQLFHGLACAHDAQVVHRDLKPENVLLARAESPGIPFTLKVLDFGIAKFVGSGEARATSSLRTLLWGAPEQASPGSRIGPEADVWALGLLVFWLIAGDTYWHGERDLTAIFKEIAADPLISAAARGRELGARSLPPAFDAWFARAVARDPGERFPHAREAWRALSVIDLPWPENARSWRGEQSLELATTEAVPAHELPSARRAALNTTDTAASRTSTQPLTMPATASGFEPGNDSSQLAPPARAGARRRPALMLAAGLTVPLTAALVGYLLLSSAGTRALPSASSAGSVALVSAAPVVQAPPGTRFVPKGSFPVGPWQNDLGDARIVRAGATGALFSLDHSFFIDTFEVDVAAYRKCVRAGGCVESASSDPAFASLCNAQQSEREHHPINCVDRSRARTYCHWLGKRLPSEAEWERAARGDDARLYPWGNQLPLACEMAVISPLCDRTPTQTRETGSRVAAALSPFGVADLSGNVWEWVEDDWSTEPSARAALPGTPPAASSGWGVLRGGSWDQESNHATVSARLRAADDRAEVSFGFRCASQP